MWISHKCEFGKQVKEGSFRINAKLVKEELNNIINQVKHNILRETFPSGRIHKASLRLV